jgi:hypothetical protein
LDNLARLRILWSSYSQHRVAAVAKVFLEYLVDARSHQSIVSEVATDISSDDFAIDAVSGYEVFILAV